MTQPRIAGVTGGVGTTTLAWALHALDCEIYDAGNPVDVLVTHSTMYSLGVAQRALATAPQPPILAVVAAIPGSSPLSANARNRLKMTGPHVAQYREKSNRTYPAVVNVPFVGVWGDMDNPHLDARHVVTAQLQNPPGQRPPKPPKHLLGFVDAIFTLLAYIEDRYLQQAGATHRPAAPTTHPAGTDPRLPPPAAGLTAAFPPHLVSAPWPAAR